MKRYSLGKPTKLCSETDIARLFTGRDVASALAYPVRAVWCDATRRAEGDANCKFLVSIPKKRLHKAVQRVAMRRRVREAYRLNHSAYEQASENYRPVDVAFIYVADSLKPYRQVEGAMRRLLSSIHGVKLPKPDANYETSEAKLSKSEVSEAVTAKPAATNEATERIEPTA